MPRDRGEICGEWRVREHSPPSGRGVPPGGRWLVDCECGAEGKGGGGMTAGGLRCWLAHAPSAERLIRSFPVRSRACRDGRPLYSPRRGPCRLSFACIRLPFMAAPPPLSEGGGAFPPSCSLHSWNSRGGSTIIPEGPNTLRWAESGRPARVGRGPVGGRVGRGVTSWPSSRRASWRGPSWRGPSWKPSWRVCLRGFRS